MRTHHVPSTDGVVLEVHDRGTSPSSSSSGLERDEPTVLLLAHAHGLHSRTSDAAAAVRGTYGWHLQARIHEQKGYEHLVPYPE